MVTKETRLDYDEAWRKRKDGTMELVESRAVERETSSLDPLELLQARVADLEERLKVVEQKL